ncbi:UDP-glucose 4-epimerase GalE [Rummeliibacillus sp. SL167]|uniref:UDP-glucose 4-epimerase GalE n=1 Tax=Rummeliibacillus sp. SL167 TaxID=2579792 RepID=UPI002104F90A|nr:UDP-glucose 4-epimerase GalE [Rummeliibacillus sp. SL167]
MNGKHILVTGAAGYIGSHACIELLEAGFQIIALDNLSNSCQISLQKVQEITGKTFPFIKGDIRDKSTLDQLFTDYEIDGVIHFAGLKAVGESVENPLAYYENNVLGSIKLLQSMQQHQVKKIVFSSSATVYGIPDEVPIDETYPLSAINPYGQTKLMIEQVLQDIAHADPEWHIALLRYFNPIGAHESGKIGENPSGIPNNLMPYITQVAVGKRQVLSIFGDDYDTPDGTGVRDYIHVVDLAKGHLKALEYLSDHKGIAAFNLGTGTGHSVLELVHAFEKATGKKIPYQIVDRRPGDSAVCYADTTKAEQLLHWKAQFDIERMCKDSWRWQSNNPNGFE